MFVSNFCESVNGLHSFFLEKKSNQNQIALFSCLWVQVLLPWRHCTTIYISEKLTAYMFTSRARKEIDGGENLICDYLQSDRDRFFMDDRDGQET